MDKPDEEFHDLGASLLDTRDFLTILTLVVHSLGMISFSPEQERAALETLTRHAFCTAEDAVRAWEHEEQKAVDSA